MPERDVRALAASGHNSFIVLAEWLKENRESIEHRLDRQDAKLQEIFNEVRKTNARVTDLEKGAELAQTLQTGRKEWEAERSSADKEVAVSRIEAGRRRSDRVWKGLQLAVALVGGGAFASLGAALGWW